MNDRKASKHIISLQIVLVFLLLLTAIIILNTYEFGIPEEILTLITAVLSSIFASFLVGAFFQWKLMSQLLLKSDEKLSIINELNKSGITQYFANFKDIPIKEMLHKSKKIDFYAIFANTLIKSIDADLREIFQKKGVEINFYFAHPDNHFIPALGKFWEKESIEYNASGIKDKIESTVSILKKIIVNLTSEKKLKAKISINLLKNNPVFYSMYKFNNEIVFCPSKNISGKEYPPPAFICIKNGNEDCLYERINWELNTIKQNKEYQVVYPQ